MEAEGFISDEKDRNLPLLLLVEDEPVAASDDIARPRRDVLKMDVCPRDDVGMLPDVVK